MAFPWIFHSNFSGGVATEWDSETDTASQMSFPHYSHLATLPDRHATPFTGAYCCKLSLTGGTATAILTEADVNISDTATAYFSFNLFFSENFSSSSGTDVVHILDLIGSGPAVTVAIGFNCAVEDLTTQPTTLGDIFLGTGSGISGAVPDTFGTLPIERGQWYTVEALVNIETNSSGVVTLYINKAGDVPNSDVYATDTSQTHIAVTDARFGLVNHAATTTGYFLLDNFICDDAHIYAVLQRYPRNVTVTKTDTLFVGPGVIDDVNLIVGADTNGILKFYDTDVADINGDQNLIMELRQATTNSQTISWRGPPLVFEKGCHVTVAGTGAIAQLMNINHTSAYGSDALVRRLGISKPAIHALGVTS